MEAGHPNLTTQKSFYVEISRARDRAELVTEDAQALRIRLEAVTGERISALEEIGEAVRPERGREGKALAEKAEPQRETADCPRSGKETGGDLFRDKAPGTEPPTRGKQIEMDTGL